VSGQIGPKIHCHTYGGNTVKLRIIAAPAVIALSGAFLAACGDPNNDDLSPAPGTGDDTVIIDPTTAPAIEPTYEDPMLDDEDTTLDEDADA